MSSTTGVPVVPLPPTTAVGEAANQALRYANTSSTCTPVALLKSAWQQGVTPTPAALHAGVPVAAVHRPLGPVHSAEVSTAHVLPRQQIPIGCGHGLVGVHAAPVVHTLPAAHAACAVTEQAPVAVTQHEPVTGCGHGWGRQSTSMPRNVPWAVVHAARVSTVHAPDAAQHAPVGWGQFAAVHKTPVPANVPGHCRESIVAHVPSR